ncbi:pyridoxal 5'-phosphate synthase glutaminase subunit PdxT [Aquipuribacter sp. MA13-6]|uniref:pyridoxal 5'-phosphate synthase glutaminase subunit PdxT n=1 Tax=unclassified Aquipuribacter TaxID=2635084 RepID=UPI003EE841CD
MSATAQGSHVQGALTGVSTAVSPTGPTGAPTGPTGAVTGPGTPAVVGVLAVQGDVREHVAVLRRLGAEVVLVRRPAELERVDALVLPGGESTAIDRLVRAFDLQGPLRSRIRAGMPVLGSCAGMILLADRLTETAAGQQTLGGIDMTVRRNGFGRQVDSFETDLDVVGLTGPAVHAVFIRAPQVVQVGPQVQVLARVARPGSGDTIVAVRQGTLLATAFHPEVSGDDRFHRVLVELAGQAHDAAGPRTTKET